MDKLAFGKHGEDMAVAHLKKSGYEILQRNYRYKRAEIDIIAIKNGTLVFVEVKTRSQIRYGYPEEFVSLSQEERIIDASAYFMEQEIVNFQFIRFDIIAIIGNNQNFSLTHIKDAFH